MRRDVHDAVVKRQAAAKLVEFYEQQAVPNARATVEAARAAYSAGEGTVLVLIQAQQTLTNQQRAQVAAMRDFAQATAELERAIGGRGPETRGNIESGAPEDGSEPQPANAVQSSGGKP